MRTFSSYQNNIFDFVSNGTGNAVVNAVAGSGKSFTIEHAQKLTNLASIFLAFNKAIADELKGRGVNARTFHSLCYSPVTRTRGVRSVTADKLRKLCRENIGRNTEELYGPFARKLVGLAKNAGVGCLLHDKPETWANMIEYYDLQLEKDDANLDDAIDFSRTLFKWSNESEMVDFDDLLYFVVRDGIRLPNFPWIFVDEAQDTNALQREILRKIMSPYSRMIAVGDPCQSIYGFRGATSNSIDIIKEEFNCIELPLSITYRCASKIVERAQEYVPHIEAAETAQEGEVINYGYQWDLSIFKAQDLVVSRTVKPLISLAYKFIKQHVPVTILGRDIGDGLKSLCKKMNSDSIDYLIERLNTYEHREVKIALDNGKDSKAEQIQDKVSCIMTLIDTLSEDNRTIEALYDVIDNLFRDKDRAVLLSTIHKSKGLEADRVFWLGASMCLSPWAKQTWQVQQEYNLCYVAITRAKSMLAYIEQE